ncbi:hypothetical protein Ciccas_001027 [Cichlidogyrus casuarinus]|uniref:Uncharacterized protein n=1 Tax=Cichlidogyrus casuarinus TaxID=1844966 RepID=A0ABD2QNH4_9PLAT
MSTSKKHKVRVREVKSRPDAEVPAFNECFPQIQLRENWSLFDADHDLPLTRHPRGVSYPMQQVTDRTHSLGPVILCAEPPSDSEPSTFNEYPPIKERRKHSKTNKLPCSPTATRATSSSNFDSIKDDLKTALANDPESARKDDSSSDNSSIKQPEFYKKLLLENAHEMKDDDKVGFLLQKKCSNSQLGNFNFQSKRKSLAMVFNNIGEKLGLSLHNDEEEEEEDIMYNREFRS